MAYSADLRKRVLCFVNEGNSKTLAAKQFQVSRAIVFVWCKTPEKLKPDKTGPKTCTKLNLEHLHTMISERPTAYQDELASPLGVCRQTVGRGLKKLNLTRKKNDNVSRKRRHS